MTDIVLTGAKYLIIILFAYFTYISFRAQRDVPDERKKMSFMLQRISMLLIHALAFFSICIHVQIDSAIEMTMGQALGIYAGQLLYLIIMSCVIPHFVPLSKGLNNVMCMFLAIGFIIQTRLDYDTALRQLIIVAVSSIVFLICVFLCKRAKFMRNLTWVYATVGMALLALMLVLSRVVYGAKLAIDLGFFSFQPAEFVKILFVLFVASAFYHANNRKTVLLTAICAAIHILILVFCHDLGSALILFVIYVLMLYAATKKLSYVGISLAGLAVASVGAYYMFDHVKVRVTAWLDPWSSIESSGYQIAQALFAVGTGGWFGSGLFGGKPKSVPVVSNDMIFSAISEELGGLFSLMLILLCLCFVLMIFRVALRVNNPFYKLLALGLGSAYGFQVFLTIGGTIKFIPLTGVNLPFISSGGSSLLASLIMLGMVQALYVISEADVEREREMVASGAPIYEFDGYEHHRKPEYPEEQEPEEDVRRGRQRYPEEREPEEEARRGRQRYPEEREPEEEARRGKSDYSEEEARRRRSEHTEKEPDEKTRQRKQEHTEEEPAGKGRRGRQRYPDERELEEEGHRRRPDHVDEREPVRNRKKKSRFEQESLSEDRKTQTSRIQQLNLDEEPVFEPQEDFYDFRDNEYDVQESEAREDDSDATRVYRPEQELPSENKRERRRSRFRENEKEEPGLSQRERIQEVTPFDEERAGRSKRARRQDPEFFEDDQFSENEHPERSQRERIQEMKPKK